MRMISLHSLDDLLYIILFKQLFVEQHIIATKEIVADNEYFLNTATTGRNYEQYLTGFSCKKIRSHHILYSYRLHQAATHHITSLK